MFYTLAYFFAYENWWFTSIPASNYRALAMCESLVWSKHCITQLNAPITLRRGSTERTKINRRRQTGPPRPEAHSWCMSFPTTNNIVVGDSVVGDSVFGGYVVGEYVIGEYVVGHSVGSPMGGVGEGHGG